MLIYIYRQTDTDRHTQMEMYRQNQTMHEEEIVKDLNSLEFICIGTQNPDKFSFPAACFWYRNKVHHLTTRGQFWSIRNVLWRDTHCHVLTYILHITKCINKNEATHHHLTPSGVKLTHYANRGEKLTHHTTRGETNTSHHQGWNINHTTMGETNTFHHQGWN